MSKQAGDSKSDRPATETARRGRPLPKLLGLVALAVALATAGAYWWWSHEASRRLQNLIDAYVAAGEPVFPRDFAGSPLAEEENAALLLREAAEILKPSPPDLPKLRALASNPDLARQHQERLADYVEDNARVIELVRQAGRLPLAEWNVPITSPVLNVTYTDLKPQLELSHFVAAAAIDAHLRGDDAEAVTLMRAIDAQARHVSRVGPALITLLVAITVHADCCFVLEETSAGLEVCAGTASRPVTHQCTERTAVERLIAELLDESPLRSAWRRAMLGERMLILDAVNLAYGDPNGCATVTFWPVQRPVLTWRLVRPAFRLDGVYMLEYTTAVMHAGEADNYQEAMARMPAYAPPDNGIERFALLRWHLLPSYDRTVELYFRSLAFRRMAATALAIRLFEVDNGRRPQTLDELVPKYLTSVPVDPAAADGRPLGYLPKATPPRLYSVNSDGIDDGGRFELGSDGSVDVDAADLVFFLDGGRPHAPASQPGASEGVPDQGPDQADHEQTESHPQDDSYP